MKEVLLACWLITIHYTLDFPSQIDFIQ